MEILAKRNEAGSFHLTMGYVSFDMSESAIQALQKVISERLGQSSEKDKLITEKKIQAYRQVANKLVQADNRIVQKFAVLLSAEQLITLARLAQAESLYNKIMMNLSKQNKAQFEDDYRAMKGITEKQALINMEQIIPIIKQVAKEVKSLG